MTIFSILHVSDVHFGATERADQPLITSRLIKAAHAHVNGAHLRPDLCIFSGDLAHSGTADQFALGEKWLRDLVSPWRCPTFLVPGNHDVARPPAGDADFKRNLRSAAVSEPAYRDYHKEIAKTQFMSPFFDWANAEGTRKKLNLVSDWTGSRLGCRYTQRLKGIEIVVIGLNSAILSCGNDDCGRLAIDKDRLDELLLETRPEDQLVIAVSHHPIGRVKNGARSKRWLTPWNSDQVESALVARSGPHIYLHGHLHNAGGTSMTYSSGENLGFFAAGACYDHKTFPQQFAFYEIDLGNGEVTPHVFAYRKGEWRYDAERSYPVKTVLPKPLGLCEKSAAIKLVGLRDLTKEIIESHRRIGDELRKSIPRFAPELDNLISPGARDEFRHAQHEETGVKILCEDIDEILDIPNLRVEIRRALQDARGLAINHDLKRAIGILERPLLSVYSELQLTALVVSEDPRDWDKAEELLPSRGRPWHYVTLSFNAWSVKDLDKALFIAEQALSENCPSGHTLGGRDQPLHKLWNNLAYFAAEEGRQGEKALKWAQDAVTALKADPASDRKQLANYIDTLGYVTLVFARSRADIALGIKYCEAARRWGGNITFYFEHIRAAESRYATLPAD